ncbi:MFS transporter [Streptomyces europaeiscabiei]|uniref:MFS transporter n=1 Tax=Streptomyces europaeiscabiei TaxID=146819 RepID=UPI0029B9A4B8|nr:MFS transporter [Streptomyces europaeiscabiei]MDX3696757.1 MFS transporter [Streptomyces europaeiscabiei]
MESLAPTSPAQAIAVLPRSSILVAALSTVVEWYDFTLYLYMTTVLSRVFFGTGSTSLLITLAVFAVAYLMRPLGAMAFGHIGDRLGRRKVLLGSMAVMTAAMLATALLPTHDQIGSAAGALLLLLRCVMGFAVGGEYTGVTAYLVEGAPPHRRALVASLASAASEIGALLAAGVAALTVTLGRLRTRDRGQAHHQDRQERGQGAVGRLAVPGLRRSRAGRDRVTVPAAAG